ncbi:hypothetical protein [Limnohabitans sp.]|uniref:hypothetical protein n=1 Tax=Limnohabitans sp. TaxID=1907725 RepID=UPI0038B747E9
MTSVLGNLQLPPAGLPALAGDAVGRPLSTQANIQARPAKVIGSEATEPQPRAKPAPVVSDENQLAYSIDEVNNKLLVKITNHATGELVRTLEFNQFTADVHLNSKLAGHLFDQKT